MRRVLLEALCCLLCTGVASLAAEVRKHVPVRDRSTASPYWIPYPQFSDAEVRLVVNWFQDGVVSRRIHIASIPAAVAREIKVGAKLSSNVVKSLAPSPAELELKLLPLPDGYQRLLAGSVLLIFKTEEQLVVDTMPIGVR